MSDTAEPITREERERLQKRAERNPQLPQSTINRAYEAALLASEKREKKLREALRDIARQKLIAEFEIEGDVGDVEYGYDEVVRRARQALGE